jgi:NAD(P)-dependent dehydrogenase (short-subunit alcohol dehydrogenase family)
MGTYIRFLGRRFITCPPELPISLSLAGQTGIVTGSNIGLGLAACHRLLERNLSHLILAVCSPSKGAIARTELLQAHPGSTIDDWQLDLGFYSSITACAARCKTLPRIDFAVLNAAL